MPISTSSHCGRFEPIVSRRQFLQRAGVGCGAVALADLMAREGLLAAESAAVGPLAVRPGHFPAKAQAVIWLFMHGAPSAFDLFDPKPELTKRDGQSAQLDVFRIKKLGPLMKSPFSFQQHGECGAWVCDQFPNLARHVDELAFIKSLHSESQDHVPALYQINTGVIRPGLPSAGAWITYALGSRNQNLPGFVVLGSKHGLKGGPLNWHAGFLPSAYQGTLFRSQGSPILNLDRPDDVTQDDQRQQLDLLARLNGEHLVARPDEEELSARIQSFELAFHMQSEAADLIDFSHETEATQKLYGLDRGETKSFGSKCLLARRMVERGVRFIQIYSDAEWDAHDNLAKNHAENCLSVDAPIDGLLTDLKQRGLLESTLVIWGGEFGRQPVTEGNGGRDHNPRGFLAWLAGAGIKGGTSFGATDELGYKAVVDPVTVHDLHATMLHLFGLDHQRLTYQHNGRPFRLTDVAGNVLDKLLA
jgi:hypothetical protein